MKSIAKLAVIILGLFFNSVLFSQNNNMGGSVLNVNEGRALFSQTKAPDKSTVIDGSPYINGGNFQKVNIQGYSKDVQDLRYNAYEDEMEFKNNEETFYANKIDGLIIEFPKLKKVYKCLNYTYDNKSKSGYLVILSEGPTYSLFKREKVELLRGEKSPNGYTKDANDYFAKDKDLYLISKDSQFYKYPKNFKDAAELFFLDKKELETFIKSNKISFSKEPDMIKLVEFINKR
ncbi:hypothetical protein [Chryseobacterium sp. CT-SW4]|uniref:hypothetical protein n=1 Tax=Chryseobacterium sp. SW-1 TaxID=3157343 RepID=UPI003B020453